MASWLVESKWTWPAASRPTACRNLDFGIAEKTRQEGVVEGETSHHISGFTPASRKDRASDVQKDCFLRSLKMDVERIEVSVPLRDHRLDALTVLDAQQQRVDGIGRGLV